MPIWPIADMHRHEDALNSAIRGGWAWRPLPRRRKARGSSRLAFAMFRWGGLTRMTSASWRFRVLDLGCSRCA